MPTLSSLSNSGALAAGDLIAIIQTIGGSKRVRKLLAENFPGILDTFPAVTASDDAYVTWVYEAAASAARKATIQKILDAINVLTEITDTSIDVTDRRVPIYDGTTAKYTTETDVEYTRATSSPNEMGWITYGTSVRSGPSLESFGDRDSWATTGTGTASGVNPTATTPFLVDYTTTAVLNNTTSHRNSATRGLWAIKNLWYSIFLSIPTITSCRFFCGMFTTGVNRDTGDTTASQWADTGLANVGGLGFRFSTSAPDTNWQWCHATAAGSFSYVDTGVAVAAGTMYLLEMRMLDNGNFDIWINGVRRLSNQAHTAPTNVILRTTAGISTLTAAARSWRLAGYSTAQKWF